MEEKTQLTTYKSAQDKLQIDPSSTVFLTKQISNGKGKKRKDIIIVSLS
jgi:hypothetical protein